MHGGSPGLAISRWDPGGGHVPDGPTMHMVRSGLTFSRGMPKEPLKTYPGKPYEPKK